MSAAFSLSGQSAIVGIGEYGYYRGTELSILQMVLKASMEAIHDAGLKPSDIDGIIPPPGFVAWDEIGAHLGIPEIRYTACPQMGGASPVAGLINASMAIAAGLATTVLVPMGWNGYSALRPRPQPPSPAPFA